MNEIRNYLLDIVLGLIIPIIATFILLSPLLLRQGIPFYGDETWYLPISSCYWYMKTIPYSWIEGRCPIIHTEIPRVIILSLLSPIFGLEIAVKVYVLLIPSLVGISTYLALRILSKEWPLFEDEMSAKLFSFTGALFMLLPFTNSGLIGVATAPAWSCIILPLSFTLLIRYFKHGSSEDLILLCVSSFFAIANPFWIYLMSIMLILYVGVEVSVHCNKSTIFKRLMVTAFVILAFNMFWLVPTISGYLLGAGGLFQTYVPEKLISFEGLRFLGHWNLLDVIMVGEHEHYFFWPHPQNYGPLNAIIPILAVTSILIFRKNKYVLFIALTLVMGIFLTKGVWEPGGYLYYLIASGLPYGAGAILRTPTKFVPLVTFSYAFLIGLFIAKFYEKLGSLSPKKHYFKLILIGSLVFLVLSSITYGTLLDLQSYTWPRYKPTYIPSIYDEINHWLSKQEGNFKVMWIPSGGAYVWKPYIITAFPDLYSSKPAVSFTKIYPEPLKSMDNIGKLLKALGVKYVIYHGDSLDYPNEEILRDLLKQKDLKVVYTYPRIAINMSVSPREVTVPFVVFENEEYSGPIYIQSLVLTGLEGEVNDSLQVSKAGTAGLLNYKQISPVEWKVTVNASNPFILVFTESYDRLWRAYVNGKEIEPIALYGLINGFLINETGILCIKIYYTLQTYYNIGLFTSGISFIILTFLCIYRGSPRKYQSRGPTKHRHDIFRL